ncbi:hypothetical protein HDU76_007985, partial [Blyttiomyces sp. JEL0837]
MTVPSYTMIDVVPPDTMTDAEPPNTMNDVVAPYTDASYPPLSLESTFDQSSPSLTEGAASDLYSTGYPSVSDTATVTATQSNTLGGTYGTDNFASKTKSCSISTRVPSTMESPVVALEFAETPTLSSEMACRPLLTNLERQSPIQELTML